MVLVFHKMDHFWPLTEGKGQGMKSSKILNLSRQAPMTTSCEDLSPNSKYRLQQKGRVCKLVTGKPQSMQNFRTSTLYQQKGELTRKLYSSKKCPVETITTQHNNTPYPPFHQLRSTNWMKLELTCWRLYWISKTPSNPLGIICNSQVTTLLVETLHFSRNYRCWKFHTYELWHGLDTWGQLHRLFYFG